MNGRNPILPFEICMPDAEAHVMPDGGIYLYGSLDTAGYRYCSEKYVSAYSRDMRSWSVSETPSFTTDQVPWADGNVCLYAPDAAQKNEKYYLYFCMSDDSEGVALSDDPKGPFTSAARIPVKGIDPAVFIDRDGSAYYYWGQYSSKGAKLNDDMISLDADSIVDGLITEKEHYFHEGSSMRRRGDIYYYVFADISRGRPTCLGYATSKSPLGPFTYRGVIIDNSDCDPKSWNNHGSIEEIDGKWYVFYHRSSGKCEYYRRVCCEPIYFDENGLIPEVKMTSQGAGEPLHAGESIPAYLNCGLTAGSFVEQDGSVILKSGGSTIFRYFDVDCAQRALTVSGTGDAGAIRLESFKAENGLYEVTLVNRGENEFRLFSFMV